MLVVQQLKTRKRQLADRLKALWTCWEGCILVHKLVLATQLSNILPSNRYPYLFFIAIYFFFAHCFLMWSHARIIFGCRNQPMGLEVPCMLNTRLAAG